jgi:hypothetical protein
MENEVIGIFKTRLTCFLEFKSIMVAKLVVRILSSVLLKLLMTHRKKTKKLIAGVA